MEPLLIDFPTELTTDRLALRQPRPGDGAVIFPAVAASLTELKRWLPWAKDGYAVTDAEVWCRRAAAEGMARRELAYLIFTAAGEHVGNLSLFRLNWAVPTGEIGYWLATPRVGRGYMAEAVAALTATAFEMLGLVRVEIRVDDRNERSWRVAVRCGYRHEGTLRCHGRAIDGSLEDTRVYAVSRRPADSDRAGDSIRMPSANVRRQP